MKGRLAICLADSVSRSSDELFRNSSDARPSFLVYDPSDPLIAWHAHGKEGAMRCRSSNSHRGPVGPLVVVLLIAFSYSAGAQTPAQPRPMNMADHRGGLSGIVKNASGAPVSAVTVTATNAENGARFTATTDAQGAFAFPALPMGKYDVSIESAGLTTYKQTGVDVAADRRLDVNITIGAAAPGQVAVSDRDELLQQIAELRQRVADLESSAVLSEPETRVRRIEVFEDESGAIHDEPVPGAKPVDTYQRERVYRRQTINEKIEEALADADERSVSLGIDAATITQASSRTRGGDAAPVDGNAYALASADLFFTAKLAQYTVFFADVVALSGSPPDREIPGLTLLNGYTARLVNQNELNLREVWLRTELFRQRLAVIAGRLDLTNYFDHNAAANDETTQFLGDGLVNNPVLGLATNGTGFAAIFDPKMGLTFRAGVQQSNPDATNLGDSLYSLAEIGYLTTPFSLPEGNYRVWYRATNAGGLSSSSFGLSVDQKITPVMTLFGRYGNGDSPVVEEGSTSFSLGQEFHSFGVQFQNGWVFNPRDSWGIGYAKTKLAEGNNEALTEGYYNFRLTERLRLSFHLQHVFESRTDVPSFGYLVPGVRLQAAF